jgi:hypothetical protein
MILAGRYVTVVGPVVADAASAVAALTTLED